MRISNMTSSNGNKVANQFLVEGVGAGRFWNKEERLRSGDAFQSYNSMIAFRDHQGQVYLDENYWDYSVTTGKYRNQFLGEKKAETERKIKAGVYKLVDLNN